MNENFGKEAARGCLYLVLIVLVLLAALTAPALSNISELDSMNKQEMGR